MTAVLPAWLEARRSIRAFLPDAVSRADLDAMVTAACIAPAPHHSRPWRWVVLDTEPARRDLAVAMGTRWRADLDRDGVDRPRVDELVDASIERLAAAPAALLGCLTENGLDRYPDESRRRAEHGMALLSLGAAVENLMLAATDRGFASCWVAAPIFCPDVARDALALPPDWLAHALVLVGRPDPAYVGRARPPIPLDELRVYR
ncbi:MAG TPA: nitroreductase family protein [Acidimicrobiia bacterium]|jgi:F420 biosynthesis protein FbiB-like protein|nr:nitroreductase family protein [Acidimicrobiia bacterium]